MIEELPALVVVGAKLAMAVAEINSPAPLGEFLPLRKKLESMVEFGEHFSPRRRDSVVRLVAKPRTLEPARLPFMWHESISYGGRRYSLGWSSKRVNRDLKAVLTLVQRVNSMLQRDEAEAEPN